MISEKEMHLILFDDIFKSEWSFVLFRNTGSHVFLCISNVSRKHIVIVLRGIVTRLGLKEDEHLDSFQSVYGR